MASYNMQGGNGNGKGAGNGNGNGNSSADQDSNPNNLESLLAQLRRQSSPSPGPGGPGQDMHGQFAYNHNQGGQSFYGHHSNSDSPNLSGNFQSAMDSPAFLPEAPTPPVHGFNHSQFPPGLINPIGTGRAAAGDDRTAHLLNLLKFSGQGGHASSQPSSREPSMTFPQAPIAPPVIHAPAPTSADPTGLLAALMKGTLQAEPPKPEPAPSSTWNPTSPPSDTQQYLLNLLNRPKPSQNDANGPSDASALSPPPVDDEPKDNEQSLLGAPPSRSEFDFEQTLVGTLPSLDFDPKHHNSTPHSQHSQPTSTSKSGVFGGYSNSVEDHSGSSPVQRTPKSSTTPGASGSTAGPFQILKKTDSIQSSHDHKRPLSDRGAIGSPEHSRRKLEHTSSPLSNTGLARPSYVSVSPLSDTSVEQARAPHNKAQASTEGDKNKESVSEAVSGLAEQVDREAQEALARAEDEQAQAEIAQDLEHMMSAKTDQEFVQSAQIAAQAIKKELEKDENQDILEATLDADVAREVRDIVDEAAQAAHGPIADSWESAEADEIVVIEETTAPVKVYNFPMKPWITISVQDIDEPRPIFREEAILDIARLKKDFDQIDRNLVTASETYMAYGMSKAGGLRVIRQEDGKDAKLFTDTKDRIFNVAISTSPSNQHPKEAIIGTGVSGTVYWVQLKNSDRDHLEDAHPEQYGFALPPISSQEGGDAPGGVLKTRARTSSIHPDFFAVGRGKSINIIWPSFIFENNLFKNGHDRVVDTEKLLKQCSLKINTGKAGKDFTFSQDDTLMVSLDKSGRVKFWDVRDATAAKEGSDPLNPMPAHTSLEIKEPLMTLTTTPEGEKAWPTSVLLLDKFRPYQKRAALRYMVVGMKQNHTLQLWDLALGKPVQEFNFPHNKESDAVCSVMYHAPSSMIVVGHPTRNSVYFLHLSAPKYNLKNLSQVDYIQRLVAQDPSIPQPESTAVISGIREYSFANKGVLRSLNILENPAASGDGDESTLFELYAMHSKGVTCLFIKQAELGWTKDNKVIAPVDAVELGLVKISKLVTPPPLQPTEPQQPAPPTEVSSTPQIRIASRSAKDALQKTPSSQGEDKKTPESAAPTAKADRKDEVETPVQQPERTEKKGRKKKAAASAGAPGLDRQSLPTNGAPELNRSASQNKAKSSARNPVPDASSAITNQLAELTLAPNAVSQDHLNTVVTNMESRIVANISGRFDSVFTELLNQIKNFQDGRDSAFATNQSALLQMVADVLNDNTEAVLKNLIIEQINSNVIPAIRTNVDKSISDQVSSKSNAQVNAIQKEIQRLLPGAVSQTMQKPDVVKTISDKICHNVNAHVDAQVAKSVNALAPAVAKMTAQSVHQRIVEDVDSRINEAFERLEERRRDEDAKLDRLIAQTKDLSNAISSLAASQAQMQKDMIALQQQAMDENRERALVAAEPAQSRVRSHGSAGSHGQLAPAPAPPLREVTNYPIQHQQQLNHPHPHQSQHQHPQQHQFPNQEQQVVFAPTSRENREKLEFNNMVETIDGLMRSANYDEAILRWLQAGDNTEEVFQQVLSNYNPVFVADLQPLLLLSVGATVSNEFSRNTHKLLQKIGFLEVVIYSFNQILPTLDDQVRDVTPKIMSLLKTRIEQLLLDISRVAPHDQSLKTLANMVHVASRIAETVQQSRHSSGHSGAPY
ncbi:hypothetical protein B0T22DRAFT_483868 [Podospora appendiculata]|uniref:EDC4-like protein pdc1 beta-propeller domain-containing protein n=1 Tax=Podospora appendiculata TaxID=314037 RepID=A0AAE0X3L0_9PEZI|nr:hypothetical protein B0T22DRAFT_483868 [Podospora appendiculata]